ncbi:MAG: ABC transporter substrate-binding protein [Anaerolineae bacterium]
MTRYIRWQFLLILLGVVLLAVLLTYLAVNYTTVIRPGYGGTYVEGLVGQPRVLNPLLCGFEQPDQALCSLIFSGLTRLNGQGEVEPDLASDWEISDDGLSYTFRLRSNAHWHDGIPVTADDVILTVRLLQDPEFPGPPEVGAQVWQRVQIEKVDRRTVRFVLPEPFAPFLDYTTVGILPSHRIAGIRAADLAVADFNSSPVGSGPFQVEEIKAEGTSITSIVLKQFPRYFRARSYLDRVQFRFYPGEREALDAYEAGEVQGVSEVRPADLSRARAMPTLSLYSAQIAEYGIVFLNLDRPDAPFFEEQEVRHALMVAIDRQRIIDEVLRGQGVVAEGPLLPGTWAYSEDMPTYSHDADRAAELLDKAGWRRPTASGVRRRGGAPLAFTLLSSNHPRRQAVAEALVEQWAQVGVEVLLETMPAAALREALESRDYQAVLIHLKVPGDPDPYPFWHETQVREGQNYAQLTHRRISEVIEQARVTPNRNARLDLYEEFQQLFAEELPALPLYVPTYTYAVDESINGVQIGPLMHPSDRFRTILNWWIVHRRVFVSEAEVRHSPR